MTISAGRPGVERLLVVLTGLHAENRQSQYPYGSKARKFGLIAEADLERFSEPDISEERIWEGESTSVVADKLAGLLTRYVDESDGLRYKWSQSGMSEGSWKVFLQTYCRLSADSTTMDSAEYHRDDEMDNLRNLMAIMDDEIFGHPEMNDPARMLAVSFKTKWWKQCHKQFESALRTMLMIKGVGDSTHGACYSDEWKPEVLSNVRAMAKRWREAPLWGMPNSPSGVDFAANNEARVDEFLAKGGFTPMYLVGSSKERSRRRR